MAAGFLTGSCMASHLYRTGQIAQMLGVTRESVRRWLVQGRMPHRIVPGTLRRRVHQDDLITFLVQNGYLQEAQALGWEPSLVLVGLEKSLTTPGLRIHYASTLLEAGELLATRAPLAVGIDFRLGRRQCLEAGKYIQARWPKVRRLALVYEDELSYLENAVGAYDRLLHQPIDSAQLANAMGAW